MTPTQAHMCPPTTAAAQLSQSHTPAAAAAALGDGRSISSTSDDGPGRIGDVTEGEPAAVAAAPLPAAAPTGVEFCPCGTAACFEELRTLNEGLLPTMRFPKSLYRALRQEPRLCWLARSGGVAIGAMAARIETDRRTKEVRAVLASPRFHGAWDGAAKTGALGGAGDLISDGRAVVALRCSGPAACTWPAWRSWRRTGEWAWVGLWWGACWGPWRPPRAGPIAGWLASNGSSSMSTWPTMMPSRFIAVWALGGRPESTTTTRGCSRRTRICCAEPCTAGPPPSGHPYELLLPPPPASYSGLGGRKLLVRMQRPRAICGLSWRAGRRLMCGWVPK